MSEENAAPVVEVIAEQPAPEQAVTATPDPVEQAPEANEGDAKPAEKVFKQDDVDAIVQKRLDRERRKWEREQRLKATEAPASVPTQPVVREQFADDNAYVDALATQRAQELLAEQQAQRQHNEVLASYFEREEEALEKYDDFQQVAKNPKLPITEFMAQTIHMSDIGPDIAYYLGTNPKEAHRISQLHPLAQAREIGKLEAKVAAEPPTNKVSLAPAPIEPVVPRASVTVVDTSDAKSIQRLGNASSWIEARNAEERRKLEKRLR